MGKSFCAIEKHALLIHRSYSGDEIIAFPGTGAGGETAHDTTESAHNARMAKLIIGLSISN